MPGRIFEVIPTATNIQALANTGYLATNPTRAVVVTLPITANIRVGETVRVSGSRRGLGRGTERRAVRSHRHVAGQSRAELDVARQQPRLAGRSVFPPTAANCWPRPTGGFIYTSTDYGMNWTARDSSRNWRAVASSGDGVKLAAAVNGGFIYTSTDSGTK